MRRDKLEGEKDTDKRKQTVDTEEVYKITRGGTELKQLQVMLQDMTRVKREQKEKGNVLADDDDSDNDDHKEETHFLERTSRF